MSVSIPGNSDDWIKGKYDYTIGDLVYLTWNPTHFGLLICFENEGVNRAVVVLEHKTNSISRYPMYAIWKK